MTRCLIQYIHVPMAHPVQLYLRHLIRYIYNLGTPSNTLITRCLIQYIHIPGAHPVHLYPRHPIRNIHNLGTPSNTLVTRCPIQYIHVPEAHPVHLYPRHPIRKIHNLGTPSNTLVTRCPIRYIYVPEASSDASMSWTPHLIHLCPGRFIRCPFLEAHERENNVKENLRGKSSIFLWRKSLPKMAITSPLGFCSEESLNMAQDGRTDFLAEPNAMNEKKK